MNEILRDIDCTRLVGDIHQAEAAKRGAEWQAYARSRALPLDYARYVTGLYTLRAYLRGRVHRNNPPPEVRDYNRSVRSDPNAVGAPMRWNRLEHNREVALRMAAKYQRLAA